MQLLIVASSGLALGLALLVWGLRERNFRYAAQRERDDFKRTAEKNKEVAIDLREMVLRLEKENSASQTRIKELRELLKKTNNPKVIHAWLDAESKKEVL